MSRRLRFFLTRENNPKMLKIATLRREKDRNPDAFALLRSSPSSQLEYDFELMDDAHPTEDQADSSGSPLEPHFFPYHNVCYIGKLRDNDVSNAKVAPR
jgi:hypothetical protein